MLHRALGLAHRDQHARPHEAGLSLGHVTVLPVYPVVSCANENNHIHSKSAGLHWSDGGAGGAGTRARPSAALSPPLPPGHPVGSAV